MLLTKEILNEELLMNCNTCTTMRHQNPTFCEKTKDKKTINSPFGCH